MPDAASLPTALIVGASRGLGLGLAQSYLARGWRVIATVRDPAAPAGLDALHRAHGTRLVIEDVDVVHEERIAALRDRLSKRQLQLLFVNAGVMTDPQRPIGRISTADFNWIMASNVLGPMRVIEQLHPLVAADGAVAAMSSGLGSVSGNESGGYDAYRASKAALNTLLRCFATRSANGRAVLAISPGWVRTDMGGADAPLDIETSTNGIADAIEARRLDPDRPRNDALFVDHRNRIVAW
jgi:NAD(P)-dependent dehydrogenase (short-subunit alcohol dehydrogenase family)